MERMFTLLVVSLVFLMWAPVAAQEATPAASGFTDLGLPTIDVTVTAEGFEGIPASLEAGRYLVSVTVEEGASEFGGGIAFVQAPDGMAADAFLATFVAPPDESGVGSVAATPVEGVEASPASEEVAMDGPPDVLFDATYAGGTYSFGGPSEVILDLTPGEWIGWADDPSAPQQPVVFEVTGEMPDDLTEPESAATIVMGEYMINVTEGELTSGPQVVRIDNVGAQPHFIGWFQLPNGTTEEQIQVVLDEEMQAEMSGTPATFSDINPEEDLMPITFTATQSTGTSIWITVDITAGTHGLVCFFPDVQDGLPHAYHGMFTVIEVAE